MQVFLPNSMVVRSTLVLRENPKNIGGLLTHTNSISVMGK